jgi:hypothetical protein
LAFGVSLLGARADKVDDFITAQMQQSHIAGLALATVAEAKEAPRRRKTQSRAVHFHGRKRRKQR